MILKFLSYKPKQALGGKYTGNAQMHSEQRLKVTSTVWEKTKEYWTSGQQHIVLETHFEMTKKNWRLFARISCMSLDHAEIL